MAESLTVHVRGIDPEVWQALRVEAVKRRVSVAKLIESLWRDHEAKVAASETGR